MSGCEPGETVGAWLCQAGQVLRAAAIENPRMEARELLAHAMGTTTDALLREPRAPVPVEAGARFTEALKRRAAREPLQLILGTTGFWTLTLEVTRDTLIPRPDTETLIETALALRPDRGAVRRVLDLGTGTGALLLAALAEYDGASGIGVDRVPGAVALAARNAARNGLAARGSFVLGDWGEGLEGRFDLVLSNPPYIESGAIPGLMPEVAAHEPASALDGGADGLDAYRAIIAGLPRLLAPDGLAVLELGQGQAPAVSALAEAQGLRVLALRDDLGGIPRALALALPEKAVGAAGESP